MSEFIKLIKQITEFGTSSHLAWRDQNGILKKLLVDLYSVYLNLNPVHEETDDHESPHFDYHEIRKKVESNFPDFGLYSKVLDMHKIVQSPEPAIGDAVDDLTDIIKDLLAVKWRFENTSETDALWHFEFLMRNHSEQHLIDLLKYLKESE